MLQIIGLKERPSGIKSAWIGKGTIGGTEMVIVKIGATGTDVAVEIDAEIDVKMTNCLAIMRLMKPYLRHRIIPMPTREKLTGVLIIPKITES
ncbi:MAG: hypothetical protein ACO3I1_08325 [Burkholderiales bacterium]